MGYQDRHEARSMGEGEGVISYQSMSKEELIRILASESARRHRMEEQIERLTKCIRYQNPQDGWRYEFITGSLRVIQLLAENGNGPVERAEAHKFIAKLHPLLY